VIAHGGGGKDCGWREYLTHLADAVRTRFGLSDADKDLLKAQQEDMIERLAAPITEIEHW